MPRLAPLLLTVVFLAAAPALTRADDVADTTLTRVGQAAPAIECTTLAGGTFKLADQHGKVVVVDFFATWCGPCVEEMPRLEKEVWQKFKGDKFALVALGRGHQNKELAPFQKKLSLTFPLAGDPKSAAYSGYAGKYIPRTYVIGADGKIAFQSAGYSDEEFTQMVKVIETELKKVK